MKSLSWITSSSEISRVRQIVPEKKHTALYRCYYKQKGGKSARIIVVAIDEKRKQLELYVKKITFIEL